MNIRFLMLAALVGGYWLTGFAEDNKPKLVRQVFVPAKREHGASWSPLRPFHDEPGVFFLQAWAGIAERFPVREKEGPLLFEVVVVEGNDDHLTLEVRSKEETQKIDIRRDKPAAVQVGGTRYELLYPSTSVAAAEHEQPTTNQVMLIVTRRQKG